MVIGLMNNNLQTAMIEQQTFVAEVTELKQAQESLMIHMAGLSPYNSHLTPEQQIRLEEELNSGFRDWLVTSGNLRQVLDLVHLERKETN